MDGRRRAIATALALSFAVLAGGCRREYWCECTVDIPGLTASNANTVAEAVLVYGGVDPQSLKWDFAGRKLTLRFDSMKVAQTNIRMAIEKRGIEVRHPAKTSGPAGYIDERPPSVPAPSR